MKKRRIGAAVWLLMAACLYFFENNTGTRVVLCGSLLFLLAPPLHRVLFAAKEARRADNPTLLTLRTFVQREADEPGDLRLYMPGDPIRLIHWKLSAKKDELLIRETAPETAEEEQAATLPPDRQPPLPRNRFAWLPAGLLILCAVLLWAIPEANRSAQALCNRIFAASEQVNAYVYDYFPVPEHQSILPAAGLLAAASLPALALILRSRVIALGAMAACTLFQTYFGLSFPPAVNILLYGLLALRMMQQPLCRRRLLTFAGTLLGTVLLVVLLIPGADPATEAASEAVRDRLSLIARQFAGSVSETPEGETETRHLHTLSLQTGNDEARADREYRLVTVEEEQISVPRWVNWLKIVLLFGAVLALLILPFAPFLLLNARKRKAAEARKAFASENVGEAVCAIFRQVILWLDAVGRGAGNRLYRDWTEQLPEGLPEGYALRFARCAEDCEEALYSSHALPEEKRQQALDLLKETEESLFRTADRKQQFLIRYWMCLCE